MIYNIISRQQVLGGVVNLLALALLALGVHPKTENLGLGFQCTRHLYHTHTHTHTHYI